MSGFDTKKRAQMILLELNLARTSPETYQRVLQEHRIKFRGNHFLLADNVTLMQTMEGVAAVDEAIRFLSTQKKIPELTWSQGLACAAAQLVSEQSLSGETGHLGTNTGDMQKRIERHGKWIGTIGENIGYGPSDPRLSVIQLIVDDGVRDRGHRTNIYNENFKTVGISCGSHPKYDSMSVMDFAGGFI
jgi:uncharacterized protein YkwD